MDEARFDQLERRLKALVEDLRFPPTPDVWNGFQRQAFGRGSRIVRIKGWAWAAAAILVALVVLTVSVPTVRATIGEILEQGSVRILLRGSEPEGGLLESGAVSPAAAGGMGDPELAGKTTLQAAESAVSFRITQPTYPPGLGSPDHVYLQHSDGWIVIQVWGETGVDSPLVLYLVERGAFITKQDPPVLRRATVDGEPAIWTSGAHFLQLEAGGYESRRLVQGHVLIWTRGDVTYRLETDLPLEEAIKVAESVR